MSYDEAKVAKFLKLLDAGDVQAHQSVGLLEGVTRTLVLHGIHRDVAHAGDAFHLSVEVKGSACDRYAVAAAFLLWGFTKDVIQ